MNIFWYDNQLIFDLNGSMAMEGGSQEKGKGRMGGKEGGEGARRGNEGAKGEKRGGTKIGMHWEAGKSKRGAKSG